MNEKKYWIVSLRAAACCAVVFIHIVGGWIGENWLQPLPAERVIFDQIILQTAVRWAVPCFLMISGYLLLAPEKQTGYDKVKKYISRMIRILLTFGLVYCIAELVMSEGTAGLPGIIPRAALNLLEGNSWSHMWYIYMMLGLYILTPPIKAFTDKAGTKDMAVLLACLFAFTVVFPTVNSLLGIGLFNVLPVASYTLFYYIMGQFVRRIHSNKAMLACFVTGIIGFTFLMVLKRYGTDVSYNADNMFVALYTVPLFYFAQNSRFLDRLGKNKAVSLISDYSLGIYVIHPFFLNLANKYFHIFPDILPVMIGEIVFFAAAFAGSILMLFIIYRIKPLRVITGL